MMPLYDGTPAHIHIHFIFLASRIIGLHFATNDIVYLRSNFSAGSRKLFNSETWTFPPFKVIQGRWIWCQSKVHMRLPIYSVIVTLVLSCTISEIWQLLCAPDLTPIPASFWGCARCIRSPMLGDQRAWALSYLAVKLFSKNSKLFDHGTQTSQTDRQTDRQTDGRTTCNLITELWTSIAR